MFGQAKLKKEKEIKIKSLEIKVQPQKDQKDQLVNPAVYDPRLGPLAYARVKSPDVKIDFKKLYDAEKVSEKFPAVPRKNDEKSRQTTCGVRIPEKYQIFLSSSSSLEQNLDEERKQAVLYLLTLNKIDENDKKELNELLVKIDNNIAFKNQFIILLQKIEQLGVDCKIQRDVGEELSFQQALNFFKENIFNDNFAGNQSSLYFETMKQKLESIYTLLIDPSIPEIKKVKSLKFLANNLAVCGPGGFSHLDETLNELNPVNSIPGWLMEFRTQILKSLAAKYSISHKIYEGNEKHVGISFERLAESLGLNPRSDVNKIEDEHHEKTQLDNNPNKKHQAQNDFFTNPNNPQRKWLEQEYKKEFTPRKICENLWFNVISELNLIAKHESQEYLNSFNAEEKKRYNIQKKSADFKEKKLVPGKWPSGFSVIKKINNFLESQGIKVDENKFYQYDDSFENFSINAVALVDAFLKALEKSDLFLGHPWMLPNGNLYVLKNYYPPYQIQEKASEAKEKEEKFSRSQINEVLEAWDLLPPQDAYYLFKTLMRRELNFLDFIFSKKNQPPLYSIAYTIFEEALEQNDIQLINTLLKEDDLVEHILENSERKTEIIKLLSDRLVLADEMKEEKKEDKLISFLFKEHTKIKELKKLCLHVLHGEYKQANEILMKKPQLLLYKTYAKDYSGRTIYGTPYQMALGAGDVNRAKLDKDNKPILDDKGQIQILHKDEGIAEMLRGHFIKALNNDEIKASEEIQKQQEQQFPASYAKEAKEKHANDLKALNKVVAAIEKANVIFKDGKDYNACKGEVELVMDEDCKAALEEFKEYLRPKNTLTRGFHFNNNLLLEALKSYSDEKRYSAFGGNKLSPSPKNLLMCRQVLGGIQRYLTCCYAQALCKPLYDIVIKQEKLPRNSTAPGFFYPLSNNLPHRLGYDYVAIAGERLLGVITSPILEGERRQLERLCEEKAVVLQELMPQRIENPSTNHRCLVM